MAKTELDKKEGQGRYHRVHTQQPRCAAKNGLRKTQKTNYNKSSMETNDSTTKELPPSHRQHHLLQLQQQYIPPPQYLRSRPRMICSASLNMYTYLLQDGLALLGRPPLLPFGRLACVRHTLF